MINCEIFKGSDGLFYWRTRNTRNRKITAVAGEGFTRKASAKRSLVKHCADAAHAFERELIDLTLDKTK